MAKSGSKMPLPKLDDLFTTEEERASETLEKVIDIPLSNISDFPNHPFKVVENEDMFDMARSIDKHGVLVPALVRPLKDGTYQMIAGHRRKKQVKLQEKKLCLVLFVSLQMMKLLS